MSPTSIGIIFNALLQANGDDLERANRAFSGMSDAELDKEHGESGRTRRQIWNEYKRHRAQNTLAREEFQALIGGAR